MQKSNDKKKQKVENFEEASINVDSLKANKIVYGVLHWNKTSIKFTLALISTGWRLLRSQQAPVAARKYLPSIAVEPTIGVGIFGRFVCELELFFWQHRVTSR